MAAGALKADHSALANVNNDLANVNANGFLAMMPENVGDPTGVVTRVTPGKSTPVSSLIPVGVAGTTAISQSASAVHTTGLNTDLAQTGTGYFVVQTPQGIAYTRDGRFHVTTNGHLANASGAVLLNQAGKPIQVHAQAFTVTAAGVINQSGSAPQQIGLTDLKAQGLKALQNGLLTGTRAPYQGAVLQGAVNRSNVSLTHAVSSLVKWQSAYQANAQVVSEEQTRLNLASQIGQLPPNTP